MIYYSHSYRPADKDINEFFQELMLSEGLTPSLDPPSDRLNSAKPERHLRSTDGMIAVLTYRDPEPSRYILYEIALCMRAQKPVLVFVEDVLPNNIVSEFLLQRRFSRGHYLREVRNHRHALKILKTYIGAEPPPTYEPTSEQRSCLIIGASSISDSQCDEIKQTLISLSYNPRVSPISNDCLSYAQPYESLIAQSILCVAFAENVAPSEFYLIGAARATLTPTIMLSQNPKYVFDSKVPNEYQPRIVSTNDIGMLCETLNNEINVFQEDYLELKEQDEVIRYRTALIREGRISSGMYPAHARDTIINIVTEELDMSKDKIQVSGIVGPVNIQSKLDHVNQIVHHAPAINDDKKQEFAHLIDMLREALQAASGKRPDDTERVAQTAELVATEMARPKPNRQFLNVTIDGLKEAAKAVEDIAPGVIKVAAMVASFVAGL